MLFNINVFIFLRMSTIIGNNFQPLLTLKVTAYELNIKPVLSRIWVRYKDPLIASLSIYSVSDKDKATVYCFVNFVPLNITE